MTGGWITGPSQFTKLSTKRFLEKIGYSIARYGDMQRLRSLEGPASDMILLQSIDDPEMAAKALAHMRGSHSQLRQDLFVLSRLAFKRGGFFVEFGATNGVALSNTYLMEKEFGWNGILAEPGRRWHRDLDSNRRAIIDKSCVWSSSGSLLVFREADQAEYSTIADYSAADSHELLRKTGSNYEVTTISLYDLLQKHRAPKFVDYLSIDTEGSEFDILRNFDFSSYKFRVITCEHNYTASREKIHTLLTKNGYSRVLENISKFDDWYVLDADLDAE